MGTYSRPHQTVLPRGPESLSRCARCGSGLVQPQGWKELTCDAVLVRLRCPECFHACAGSVTHRALAEYDEELVDSRNVIRAQYEAVVRHNMEELLERFARALELDLITADDFARCGGARSHG
jgi:ribosomal protein S27E